MKIHAQFLYSETTTHIDPQMRPIKNADSGKLMDENYDVEL